jgi:hypothetical protein
MSIANPKQSVLGLLNLEPTVLITKILASAAIALVSCVGGAAPASADSCAGGTTPASAGSGPFGALGCSCPETAPARSPALREEELNRGIRDGYSKGFTSFPRC